MKTYNIKDFVKGWIIGGFQLSIFQTKEFEIAYKTYKAGDKEAAHVHKIATEITLIATGSVRMNGVGYQEGQIIETEPGEATDFEALTDCSTVVIKTPSVAGDKYLV